jgi:hypothetical protein
MGQRRSENGERDLAGRFPNKDEIVAAIRAVAEKLKHVPSRAEFIRESGIGEYRVTRWFDSWNDAVRAAGFEPHTKNIRLGDATLLQDWGECVRRLRHIPTYVKYQRDGTFSPEVFQRRFGAWSRMAEVFREFAAGKPEWNDVVTLLPPPITGSTLADSACSDGDETATAIEPTAEYEHSALRDRPTYGNPIDFRGLRHEPVNEQGVVFLFGMLAKELGYMVEAVQTGFPDCEAKRQIGPNKWQRVRIEFEFESRNFRDHGHPTDGCDVIVCWRHNWREVPAGLEIVELRSVINSLSRSDD